MSLWEAGRVVTVTGAIDPEEVGAALVHEHVFVNLHRYHVPAPDPLLAANLAGPVAMHHLGHLRNHPEWSLDNMVLDDEAAATDEVRRWAVAGGQTICDVSSRGIRIDTKLPDLRRLALATGVHVVVGTGCYIAAHHEPFVATADTEVLAELFTREITVGIGSTGIRAGIIGEIGLGTPPHPDEWKVLRAAAQAHQATGAPIVLHHSDGRTYQVPMAALDALAGWGVDPRRVVVAHCGFYSDVAPLGELARRGAYVSFDHFGMPGYESELNWQYPQELDYVVRVLELIEDGAIERVLLSHDVCAKTQLRCFGGTGYDHMHTFVRALFVRSGLSKNDFETMTVANPKQVLTLGR